MYDAFKFYGKKVGDVRPEQLIDLDGGQLALPYRFYYMTCHREENAGTDESLKEILSAMNSLEYPCIYPVHPRNQERVKRLKEKYGFDNIIACKPVGYLMSVYLTLHCEKIVTDSGGLQREAFFAGKQCVTIFDYVVWPETMIDNRNQLAKAEQGDILQKLSAEQHIDETVQPFGDGDAASKIVDIISEELG
jgi:UDP-N-acetylglucosamine 2-epimerase (non-hydrolysing)/UDP-GlcNAc3NAcA epimerase